MRVGLVRRLASTVCQRGHRGSERSASGRGRCGTLAAAAFFVRKRREAAFSSGENPGGRGRPCRSGAQKRAATTTRLYSAQPSAPPAPKQPIENSGAGEVQLDADVHRPFEKPAGPASCAPAHERPRRFRHAPMFQPPSNSKENLGRSGRPSTRAVHHAFAASSTRPDALGAQRSFPSIAYRDTSARTSSCSWRPRRRIASIVLRGCREKSGSRRGQDGWRRPSRTRRWPPGNPRTASRAWPGASANGSRAASRRRSLCSTRAAGRSARADGRSARPPEATHRRG